MEDPKDRLEQILKAKNYSAKDQKWMFDYLSSSDISELRLLGYNQFKASTENTKSILDQDTSNLILQKIHNSIKVKRISNIVPLYRKKWFVAASIILIMFSVATYFYSAEQQYVALKQNNSQLKTDIEPGGNKAVLTLADGSKIILDNAQNGVLSNQDGAIITKADNGQLVYDASLATLKNESNSYNTITTPRSGQYQVVLPDGTQVWLNSASSLRFPTLFTGKQRKVELSGEAYFEVAKNKNQPFIISSGNQTIEVLGTHFNVNAYHDESLIKTTLLEGSVKVTNASSSVLLKPGQQSIADNNQPNPIDVVAAEPDEAIAWKKGYFLFNNEELTSIMREISRWYDVDVVYEGDVKHLHFGGMVSRSKNISSVLKIMELTKRIHFKIEGRRVIVMP